MQANNTKKKTIIITGGSGQVGFDLCQRIDKDKFNIIATDLNYPENKISGVDYYLYDTTNIEEKKKFYDYVQNKYKKIDILVNNVGVAVFSDFTERTEDEFDHVMNVNLKSVFFDIQCFIKFFDLNKLKVGKIINISSIFGLVSPDFRNYTDLARKSSEVYGATKAGIIQLTKYFAVHLAERNVSVNCISPGGIFNNRDPQGKDFIKNYSFRTPMKRMADVSEISNAILFYINYESNFLTGQNIVVDGGLTCW